VSPTFGIAFGGGGARGLAHIHVIEALDELGIRPAVIAGSSIGAIMGAGMAAGISGKDIREHALSILTHRAEVASRMWRARPGTLAEMMKGGLRISQFNIVRIIGAFLPDQMPGTFEEMEIPLKVTATDFFGHNLVVLSEGDLHSALAASSALPAVFRPVMRDHRLLIDGGIYNPVPFDLIADEVDITIAVDVIGTPSNGTRDRPTTIDLLYGASQLMMHAIVANKLGHCRPDILIRPPVSRFRVLDFLKVDAVMAETAAVKDEVKRAVEAALEAQPDGARPKRSRQPKSLEE